MRSTGLATVVGQTADFDFK